MPETSARIFSFEFFPPATAEGAAKLASTRAELTKLGPKFFSVTYGAGGSTRDRTLDAVLEIQSAGQRAAPHISCIGSSRESIRATLATYRDHGIRHLVALRGDLPSGSAGAGEFRYANELVEHIRAETGDWFHIDVACYPEYHPQAPSPAADLANFKRKVDAGADFVTTQLFFDNRFYFDFVARARAAGIKIPIVPGLMPIRSLAGVERMTKLCGASLPIPLQAELERSREDEAATIALGIAQTTAQAVELLHGGAPGIHFYTLNQSPATRVILTALKAAHLA